MKKRIAIFGSTGSIGTQALDVMRSHPELFDAEVLTASSNVDLLITQALEFQPNAVVISDQSQYPKLRDALSQTDIKVFAGQDSLEQIVEMETIDLVIMAIVGFTALKPVLKTIELGKTLAIANKETFVVAGEIMMNSALKSNALILPVDSEHSAIYQCMNGETTRTIDKIILTASGGPFRGKDKAFLETIKAKDALKHPNWEMGAKITIDSASLMNKGFEMIEAKWLFGLQAEQIEVLVHPQSIIHSMVQFNDGSVKAQLGLPDMRLPIQYAMSWPNRIANDFPKMDFTKYPNLTFEQPDIATFPNIELARTAMIVGGNMPCIVNAANEIVVHAFLADQIGFNHMPELIEEAMAQIDFVRKPTLDDYFETDRLTRIKLLERIKTL
ncbi:MAG: 1-deoxy-D-xylulose-5-phosphate reductoisomerase [Bacteroidales bacterium]|nr:1-deoxy-D-xylulose-5-phosphate reductoisomerase [Bacteroidales bacterium]